MYVLCSILFINFWLPSQPTQYAEQQSKVSDFIYKTISQLNRNNTIKLKKQKIVRNSTIINIYKKTAYQPLWNDGQNRADLIHILENAYYDGLNPADYYIDFIKQYHSTSFDKHSIKTKAKADIIMTNAALKLALHLLQGKLQPSVLYPEWNYKQRPLPDSIAHRFLHRLSTYTLKEEVNLLIPDLPLYHNLRKWFNHFDALQNKATQPLPELNTGKPLKLGDTSAMLIAVKKQLGVLTDEINTEQNGLFNYDLLLRIKEFQTQYGLTVDGIIGAETLEALSMSIEDKLNILRVNMERCRWLKRKQHPQVLVVNIADFNLYYLKNEELFYQSKVVVGKEQQQTPAFEASIKYLVLNPTWIIPYSIATEEILPIIQQDSTYLDRNEMFLSIRDSIVDHCSVDFSKYDMDNFPFVITQEAGLKNPLGLVKFIFPNEHAVYLHDTPAKIYFDETDRTFSHGCVRVQNALDLAGLLLEKENYPPQTIDSLLLTKATHRIYLKEPLPVMIMYWTCYEHNGQLFFRKDVYDRDKQILEALRASY